MSEELSDFWTYGRVQCLNLNCLHVWVAVWPVGADDLECPHCGQTDTSREDGE